MLSQFGQHRCAVRAYAAPQVECLDGLLDQHAETVQGATATSSKEANKEKAKGNVPGNDSIADRASGALDAAGDKIDEKKHEGSAKANKQGI